MFIDPALLYSAIAAGCRQAAPTGLDAAFLFGIIGAGLSVASALMKKMLSLRSIALAANASFLTYGMLEGNLVMMMLHGAMLPVNAWRVMNIRKLVRDIESVQFDAPLAEWLLPHMKQRRVKAGQVLWRRGDTATEMLYLKEGALRLIEYGELLAPGCVVGEIGLFAHDNRRTLGLECATDCTLYSLSASGLYQLYYQNPKLGFHIMRLVVERMTRNMNEARPAFGPQAHISVAQPNEVKPIEVKPIEVKPFEVKPIEVKTSEGSPHPVPYKVRASWF